MGFWSRLGFNIEYSRHVGETNDMWKFLINSWHVIRVYLAWGLELVMEFRLRLCSRVDRALALRDLDTISALGNVKGITACGCDGYQCIRKRDGYHHIGKHERYHNFGKVKGITALGNVRVSRHLETWGISLYWETWRVSLLWESEGCITTLAKVSVDTPICTGRYSWSPISVMTI